MKFLMTTVLALAIGTPALAGSLFAPVSMDSAAVMPKGVRSVRMGGFTTQIFDKYDGYGNVVPLADSFNKSVTWKQLIDSRPTAFERGQLRGGLQAEGIDLNESAGVSAGLVNTRLTSTIPVLAWGITEKLTLGMGVPVIYSSTNVSTGWTVSPMGQGRIDMLRQRGYDGKVMSVKSALENVVATKIASYGYKPLENEQRTDVGDATIGLKYQVFANDDVQIAIAPKVVVPTGRTADVNKVVDVASGDGQIDTGIAVVGDYTVTGKLVLTAAAGYTHQWEQTKAKRIPLNGDESISPDTDWNVREQLGDLYGTSLAAKYKFTQMFIGSAGYSLQYKDEDKFHGGQYTSDRYRYLERDTWQTMHAGQLALTATTVPMFRAGQFAIPLDATLALTRVFDGRNAGKLDLAIFEIAAYF